MIIRRATILGLGLMLLCGGTEANAPEVSPRPVPRAAVPVPMGAAVSAAVLATLDAAAPDEAPRPEQRPGLTATAVLVTAQAIARSPRPVPRPAGLVRMASAGAVVPVVPAGRAGRRGSVCGVNEIRGRTLPAIAGRIAGCGIAEPVEVTAVAGVALSQPATIDCTTAKALNSWVAEGVIPAVGRRGGGVAALDVVAHYSCRTRNSQRGAKVSEHGKGHAVDVSGVTLRDGSVVTVEDGWRDAKLGRIVKAMHRAACGPFGTVLGPDSDSYHQDHLHVDTARYRGGPYCR